MDNVFANVLRPAMRWQASRLLRFQGSARVDAPESTEAGLLYVHIPFCPHLCPYCSFHRVPYQEDLARHYFKALRQEIRHYAERGYRFKEVYIGGGTPTVNLLELGNTLRLIRDLFPVEAISVETNPDHLVQETFRVLQEHDVSRLSVGVQSFKESQLAAMGRLQPYGSPEMIIDGLHAAKEEFPTLNVDMMFNLPGQTLDDLNEDIDQLLDTGAGQVSFYPLMMSDATQGRVAREMGRFSHQREATMYYTILDRMSPTHSPSSVWCFSQDSNQLDEYIINYPEFVGVGSGAFSYLQGTFYANSFSVTDYNALLRKQKTGMTRARMLSFSEQRLYVLLTKLFGLSLPYQESRNLFGADRPLLLEMLSLSGVLSKQDIGYGLTRKGMYYWLIAMSEFLSGVNNLRDEMRAESSPRLVTSDDSHHESFVTKSSR
jgi:coproporphyrinogen III oxidase-like Fe-S oxidoreductase